MKFSLSDIDKQYFASHPKYVTCYFNKFVKATNPYTLDINTVLTLQQFEIPIIHDSTHTLKWNSVFKRSSKKIVITRYWVAEYGNSNVFWGFIKTTINSYYYTFRMYI